jgi:soluble lytic murein transglycosylase-like protein
VIAQSEPSVFSLFRRAQQRSPIHGGLVTVIAWNEALARPLGRRKFALPRTVANVTAGHRLLRFGVLLSGALVATALLSDARAGGEPPVPRSRSTRAFGVESFASFVTEASRRFAIPAQWIRGVMQLESAGEGRAVSPKGALGLMQIMPSTWVELSVRYGLGIDPFDAHDNIMAGAAYLREMHDRFGSPGFLAAYNAGPERYEQHLATGRPLPQETQAYVAALAPVANLERVVGDASVASRVASWRRAPLFSAQLDSVSISRQSTSTWPLKSSPDVLPTTSPAVLAPHSEGLFVHRSNEVRGR